MNTEAENEKYVVKKIRQNEVQDIWKITNKETKEVTYERTNRTQYYTAEDILENLN